MLFFRTLAAIIELGLIALIATMAGCISVDKSVTIYAAPFSYIDTDTENTSETQADGNGIEAEAGFDLLP